MITLDLIIKNIKLILIVAIVGYVVWLRKDNEILKSKNDIQSENISQLRKADSLRFCTQNLSDKEAKEYLEYENKDLKNKLAKAGIKSDRIKEIISTNYFYRDSIQKKYYAGRFIDSTKCLVIKGEIDTNGVVTISDRQFKNKMDAVAFWERKQWNFLGIKTRFMGKKQVTAKVFDDCGNSTVIQIKKQE
jgi:hypothetical protein